MDIKPKRKNTPDKNGIEFVTALSVDECTARLELAAVRTFDHRLSIRVDAKRFAVDVLTEVRATHIVIAKLVGVLAPLDDNRTRVRAVYQLVNSNYAVHSPLVRWLMAGMIGGMFGFVIGGVAGIAISLFGGADELALVSGMLVGNVFMLISTLILFVEFKAENAAVAREIPDFNVWLREHLFENGKMDDNIAEWEAFDGRQTEAQKHAGH